MRRNLCRAIHHLARQQSSVHTIQQMLHTTGSVMGCSYAVLVMKDPETGYLRIRNFCNIYCQTVREFQRKVGTGAIGRLFFEMPLVVVGSRDKKEHYEEFLLDRPYGTVAAIRVEDENAPVGFLGFYFDSEVDFSEEETDFFKAAGEIVSVALEKDRLLRLVNELRRYDDETGLLCHSFFLQKFAEELKKSERYQLPLSVVIMDCDNYKEIMDLHGMETARQLLRELAEELKSCLRGVDVVGLFGTDQFIVLMPNTEIENAQTVITRFGENIMTRLMTEKKVSTSLSIGLSNRRQNDTFETLIYRTQTALHTSRLAGRGKITRV